MRNKILESINNKLLRTNLKEIVKRIKPAVVTILAYDRKGKILSQGSGFFINIKGEVITNHHVLAGANRVEVKTSNDNDKGYPVKELIAEDSEGDLICFSIEIPERDVKFLSVNPSSPEVGDSVMVIGSPLGLDTTVSDGIVSAVRLVSPSEKLIQITAPISPGSSGSPVVNMKGEVIGVATFQNIGGQNLNFAIPSERILSLRAVKDKNIDESSKKKTEPPEEFFIGNDYALNGDYKRAIKHLKMAVKKSPNYAEAHLCIGLCNTELGYYDTAIKAYKKAISIDTKYVEAYYLLAQAYGLNESYNEVIEICKQVMSIEPESVLAHCILSFAYLCINRSKEAEETCKQAILIDPDCAQAYFVLGLAYEELGHPRKAKEAFRQAIRIDPEHADVKKTWDLLGS